MALTGWGKCSILVRDLDVTPAGKWTLLPTPAEGTTQLTATKGTKSEAKIEGGENEDVRYSANTYALAFQIRKAKGRETIIAHVDGVVAHNYEVIVIPEDQAVPSALYIKKANVSVEDNFTTADGGTDLYTFDAIKPDQSAKQVLWGAISYVLDADGTTVKSITAAANIGDFTTETKILASL